MKFATNKMSFWTLDPTFYGPEKSKEIVYQSVFMQMWYKVALNVFLYAQTYNLKYSLFNIITQIWWHLCYSCWSPRCINVGTLDLDTLVWGTLSNYTMGFCGLGALLVGQVFNGAVCTGEDVGADGAFKVDIAGGIVSLACHRWTWFLLYNPPSWVSTL